MKNKKTIILCAACAIFIAALIVGLLFPTKTISNQQSALTEPTISDLPILPERTPTLQQGKYYCVAGTFDSEATPRDCTTLTAVALPSMTIANNNAYVASFRNDTIGYYKYNGDQEVTFSEEDVNNILQLYPLYPLIQPDPDEGDRLDTAPTTPPEPPIFICTYNKDEQTLHFTYGSDTLTLKYFASDVEATQWYTQYSVDNMFTFLPNYNDYQQLNNERIS